MTNKSPLKKNETTPKEHPKKLSRKEKDELFRQMNENWAKGMDIYLANLEREKEENEHAS